MEYIRYVLYKNRFKIAALTIILMIAVLAIMYQGNKQNPKQGKFFVIEEYDKSKVQNNQIIFEQLKEGDENIKNKPIIISEINILEDRSIFKILVSLITSLLISFFTFFLIPILLKNTFVNKESLKKKLDIPFLAYFNSNFKKSKKQEKIEKVKEIKEEQLGELVTKIHANKDLKNKKKLLFISDDLREDKIDILFELATLLSNLDKKVLILDLPLEVKKEMKKVEKKEKKALKKDEIKKLTTFEEKLFCRLEEEKENKLKIYSCIDKNVKYASFDSSKKGIRNLLLNGNEILKESETKKYDYILVNGVDNFDAERYVLLARSFPTIIALTKHFKTEREKLEEFKFNIDKTDASIAGIVIVKKDKYNN